MADYRVVSADAHVVEPPNLWTDRMDPKYGDWIPHIVRENSFDKWYCGHHVLGVIAAQGANTGMRFDKETAQQMSREGRFEDVRPGGYDPHAHVKDNEMDGVHATMVYPTTGRGLISRIADQNVLRVIVSTMNDWLADFCKPYPDRLKGVAMILLDDDIEAGITELRRARDLGLTGALIPAYPAPGQFYDDPRYDPFWAAAEEMGIPISLHAGTTRPDPAYAAKSSINVEGPGLMAHDKAHRNTAQAVQRINMDHFVRMSLGHITLAGVLERYPDLKIVSVENDVGWVPFFMYRCDSTYNESTFAPYRFKGDMVPSDFLRRNVYYTFMDDPLVVRLRDLIGVDQLMWGSDYPHAESTFPRSQEILGELFKDVPEAEKAKILGGNANKMYNFN